MFLLGWLPCLDVKLGETFTFLFGTVFAALFIGAVFAALFASAVYTELSICRSFAISAASSPLIFGW